MSDKISSLISLEIMDATNEESTPEDKNKTFGTSERNLNLIESIRMFVISSKSLFDKDFFKSDSLTIFSVFQYLFLIILKFCLMKHE